MKSMIIRRGSTDLLEVPLNSPEILIGRSPNCDAVLRAPKVRPYHFLIQWIGEGDFNEASGLWTVYPIGEDDETAEVEKEGVILGDEPISLSAFQLQTVERRLFSENRLKKGAVSETFDRETVAAPLTKEAALEVLCFNPKTNLILDVSHYPHGRNGAIRGPLVKMRAKWASRQSVVIKLPRIKNVVVHNRGSNLSDVKDRITISNSDLYKVNIRDFEYYFRIVNSAGVKSPAKKLFREPVAILSCLAIAFTLAFLSYVKNSASFVKKETPQPPQRIAKIEIKEIIQPPAPPPEPPPAPTKVTEVQKPNAQSPLKKVESKNNRAAAPRFKQPLKIVPKTGLNSLAPRVDVNTVGLLGQMKKSKTANKVSADMVIHNAVITESVSGASGSVHLSQSPNGVLSEVTIKSSSADLAAAGTTLGGGEIFDPTSVGPVAREDGTNTYTVGSLKGGKAGLGREMGAFTTNEMSVSGGLDKEAVRAALAQHKREIRACYERALLARPDVKGKMTFRWTITKQGHVSSIELKSSDIKISQLESCTEAVIREVIFPQAANGQSTTVIYPFVFQKK